MNSDDTQTTSRTDWKALATMTDDEIDYSDIPPLSDAFFERSKRFAPTNAVQLDSDVLVWFKAQSIQYKSLINTVLRKYMELQLEAEQLSG